MKICSKCGLNKDLSEFYKAPRYAMGVEGHCKACKSEYSKKRSSDPEVKARINAKRRLRDRSEEQRRYALKNPEKIAQKHKRWVQKNLAKKYFWNATRRASRKNATPPWLSAIELAQIQEFYDVALAKSVQTGVKHHVDHVHPLSGHGFSGLHVPWNLQVISAQENVKKNNKVPMDQAYLFWEHLL